MQVLSRVLCFIFLEISQDEWEEKTPSVPWASPACLSHCSEPQPTERTELYNFTIISICSNRSRSGWGRRVTAQLRFSRINSPGSSDSRTETQGRIQELRAEERPSRAENLVRYDEHRDDQLGTHLVPVTGTWDQSPPASISDYDPSRGTTLLNIQYWELRELKTSWDLRQSVAVWPACPLHLNLQRGHHLIRREEKRREPNLSVIRICLHSYIFFRQLGHSKQLECLKLSELTTEVCLPWTAALCDVTL